ncbi:RNA-directed DNA polymerase from mobile element jockey-like, partial [Brachionus plicatilis]
INESTKQEIQRLLAQNPLITPKVILTLAELTKTNERINVPTDKQLYNYLQHQKKGSNAMNFAQLNEWCHRNKNVPTDNNQPFVVRKYQYQYSFALFPNFRYHSKINDFSLDAKYIQADSTYNVNKRIRMTENVDEILEEQDGTRQTRSKANNLIKSTAQSSSHSATQEAKNINPPNVPQAYPIENFWSCLSEKVYEGDWQASTEQQMINDFVSLNETFLKTSQNISIPNYQIIRSDRIGKAGGGSALCIRKSIKGKEIDTSNFEETTEKFKYFIIIGDLNAKNYNWSCNTTNQKGKILDKIISKHNLYVLNNSDPTFKRGGSVIDLSICSAILTKYFKSFRVLKEEISDHEPTLTYFKDFKIETKTFEKIDWKKLKSLLCSCPDDYPEIQKPSDLDFVVAKLTSEISNLYKESTINYNTKNPNKQILTVPNDILKLIKQKRKLKSKHWKLITKIENGDCTKSSRSITIKVNNQLKTDDSDLISNIFADNLESIFSTDESVRELDNQVLTPTLIEDNDTDSSITFNHHFWKVLRN